MSVPVLLLDLDKTLRFIRSTAMARALAESARLEWKSYDDSVFLNVVYGLMPWKEKPGSVEVQIAHGKALHDRQHEIAMASLEAWTKTWASGPQAMCNYMNGLERVRAGSLESLEMVFHDARAINSAVEQQLNSSIRTFAAIKLGATVAVALIAGGAAIAIGAGATAVSAGGATLAFGASGTAFGATSTAFSITCSLIKEWNAAPTAKVVAVSKDTGKYLAGEAIDKTADYMVKKAGVSQALHEQMLAKADRLIDHYSQMIARTGRQKVKKRAMSKLGENLAKHEVAQQGIKQSSQLGKAAGALKTGAPIVFAAWDIWDAVGDFRETWADTR